MKARMAAQGCNIPLDILPASLPRRKQARCIDLLGLSDLASCKIEPPRNACRIEVHPENLCEKIRLHDYDIDFNADPLRRRSLVVRWKEWTKLTTPCIMPEPPIMKWRGREPSIEYPILPDLICGTSCDKRFCVEEKVPIAPIPKHKVASINA